MAKKQFDDDLLTGSSIKGADDKKASKEQKKALKAKKVKEKNDSKRAEIKKEMDALKEKKSSTDNAAEIEALDKKIKALSAKYSAVGSDAGVSIAPRTKKIITSVICVVLVVALLVTYVATGAVRKGFVSSLNLPAKCFTGLTVTNGEQKAKVKVATYNFYFASQYNTLKNTKSQYEQYGLDAKEMGLDVDFEKPLSKQTYTDSETNETMTWAEHMHDLTVDAIENTYTYYLAAVAANDGEEPEITEDQKTELEETVTSYTETANKNGYTLSGYLTLAMGHGVTEEVFRTESTRQYIASNYQSDLSSGLGGAEYTDEQINAYKDEHLAELQTVDLKVFECESEDDAVAFKNALNDDGSNFAELCTEYATTDFNKRAYADESYSTEIGVTRATLQNKGYAISSAAEHTHEEGEEHSEDEELEYPGLDWVFSTDRQAGDVYQYSTSVVYVINPVSLTDRKTVNVRHILISPITDEDDTTAATDATEEQWTTAHETATKILAEWSEGEKTADSFGKLATQYTADTGSASTGGLYENVITGQMVNPFSVWCFDASRNAGDTAIVRSDFGYHIMYFVGENDQTVWQYSAQQALASTDGTAAIEDLEEEYTVKENWFGSRYFEKDVDIDS